MASYFIFCRFWPGFSYPFPFEKFNQLDEEVIDRELHVLAEAEYKANSEAIAEIKEKRLAEYKAVMCNQGQRQLGSPAGRRESAGPSVSLQEFQRRAWQIDRCRSLVQEVGSYLGWFYNGSGVLGESGPAVSNDVVTARVWLQHADCELQAAERAVRLLNDEFATHEVFGRDTLNVVFGLILASELSELQQDRAVACIHDIAEGRAYKRENVRELQTRVRQVLTSVIRSHMADNGGLVAPGRVDTPNLDEQDYQILRAMECGLLMEKNEIAAGAGLSASTVGRRDKRLNKAGLTAQPEGKQKGRRITDSGKAILQEYEKLTRE